MGKDGPQNARKNFNNTNFAIPIPIEFSASVINIYATTKGIIMTMIDATILLLLNLSLYVHENTIAAIVGRYLFRLRECSKSGARYLLGKHLF